MATKILKGVAVALIGVSVFGLTFLVSVKTMERETHIGAHTATIRATFDGKVTIEAGPLLPQIRRCVDTPLNVGALIVPKDSATNDLDVILARDAAIASQPAGEIDNIRKQVRGILLDSARIAAIAAALAIVATITLWRAIGPQRRRELLSRRPPTMPTIGWLIVVGALITTGIVTWPSTKSTAVTWVPITTEFPQLKDIPAHYASALDGVEVSAGAATSGASTLIDGATQVYRDSVVFYGKLQDTARDVDGLHEPSTGQSVALVVTDRHDNIAMDPVAKIIGDRAGATTLIDLGDDTSSGSDWEDFSLQSVQSTFKGWHIISVQGNHDAGDQNGAQADELGFTVMDGEPIKVGGVTVLGDADPRSTGAVSGYDGTDQENDDVIAAQSQALADTACERGANVSLLIVHSMQSATDAVDSGCVDLAIAGHLHRQVGPETNDKNSTSVTIGSTGGAIAAFALGSELRTDAQLALLTFEENRVVGLQIVTFHPGGDIDVGPYTLVGDLATAKAGGGAGHSAATSAQTTADLTPDLPIVARDQKPTGRHDPSRW